jgi:hypothetical protein
LLNNTVGNNNTSTGTFALLRNTSGNNNTSTGYGALQFNTAGGFNTATGEFAMQDNTTGNHNTAHGLQALLHNTTGFFNTAMGLNALAFNTTGDNNTALGINAGFNLTTGSNNIEIGNGGTAADSATIRIGTQGTQTATFIAGIADSPVTGANMVVSSTGRLGIVMSSVRYKRDIHDMGQTSAGLMKLRPVTFEYKNDPELVRQYGLVAEEVARVYPELVTRDDKGRVQSVNYLTLTSMLLNELQKRTAENQRQAYINRWQAARLAAIEGRLSALEHTTVERDRGLNLAATR